MYNLEAPVLIAFSSSPSNSDSCPTSAETAMISGVPVILFQPRNDDGRVESARVSKNDFLKGFFLFHKFYLHDRDRFKQPLDLSRFIILSEFLPVKQILPVF